MSGKGDPSVAFVAPRYGEGIVGGSEAVVGEAARGLAARGYRVEVLTTCATNHYTWANELPSGVLEDRAVTVRRFEAVTGRSRLSYVDLERRIGRGECLSELEELAWVNARFKVPELYGHLRAHARDYDAIVLSPYLLWSTIYCARIAPERSIVMPCLHDEAYARLALVEEVLSSVAGAWFLSEPEHQLAHRIALRLTPRHSVVGAAVEVPVSYDPEGFRERHGLIRPFLLYAGRREDGKGWKDLLGAFVAAITHRNLPFDLVTIGVGAAEVPERLRSRVIDLGFLEGGEVPDAFAAAEALVQPSRNESFSRTVMEAWLARRPVIANAESEVVTWHCERSGGGLTYAGPLELAECLLALAESPKLASALGERGRAYVLENYVWDHVLDAMETSLESVVAASR